MNGAAGAAACGDGGGCGGDWTNMGLRRGSERGASGELAARCEACGWVAGCVYALKAAASDDEMSLRPVAELPERRAFEPILWEQRS